MLILAIALMVVGLLVAKLSILFTIGVILAVIAVILIALGVAGHPVAGRRHFY